MATVRSIVILVMALTIAASGSPLLTHAIVHPIAVGPAGQHGALGPAVQPSQRDPAQRATPSPSPAGPRPDATFGLGFDGLTPTAIALNWTATTDLAFSYYTVEESPNGSAGSYQGVQVISSQSTTSTVVAGLAPGTPYWWQVNETGFLGSSSSSNPVNATQPTLAYLNYTSPSSTSVWFNWTNNASYGGGVSFGSYVVYEAVGSGPLTPAATITNQSTPTWTATGLSPGTSYRFYVNTTDCAPSCTTSAAATQSNIVTLGTPLPLSASIIGQRAVVDVGENDLFTCSPAGGTSPFGFAWNYGNGTFVIGASTVAHAFSAAGNVSVTCRVTDHASVTAAAAIGVVVNTELLLTASTNRTTADIAQTVAFVCAPSNGSNPYAVSWAFGDGAQASGGYPVHAYTIAGTNVAICTATDSAGVTLASAHSVVVSTDPTISINVSSREAAPGTPLTFRATMAGGSGAFSSPSWTFGPSATASGSNVTHAFAEGNDSIYVSSTDSNGYTATATTSVMITYIQVSISVAPRSVQTGSNVGYSAFVIGGAGGPYVIAWAFPGVTLYGGSATFAPQSVGTLEANVTVTDSLGGTTNTTTPAVTVTAPPPPPPNYTLYYLLGALAVLVLAGAAGFLLYRRRVIADRLQSQIGRIPPTDPSEVGRKAKVCAFCGTSNLPLRDTCSSCGRPLRRIL